MEKRRKKLRKNAKEASRLTGEMKGLIFILAIEAAVVVCTNTAIYHPYSKFDGGKRALEMPSYLVLFLVSCS